MCDSNDILFFTCKYRMEACPQMSYELFFFSLKRRKDPSCHITFWKFRKFCKTISFDLSKFKFQNRLKPKTHILGLFLDKPHRCIKIKKKFYIFAVSDLSLNYGSFGTWVSRLSKKNLSLIIFHTFFHVYGLVTRKPS